MEIYNGTYCVYIHTNKINGKMYVGQTIHGNNPNKRWSNGRGYQKNLYFGNAVQKYGWDNFDHDVIASNLTKEEACNFEKILIKELNTYDKNFGYNLTLGGEGLSGYRLSEETRKKTSEAMRGKKRSEETKLKIGKASLGRNVGRKHTEDELEKMRQAKRGKRVYNSHAGHHKPHTEEAKQKIQDASHKKKVCQKDIDDNILNTYESLSSASRATGVNLGSISLCCNGRAKTAGGFIWEFV